MKLNEIYLWFTADTDESYALARYKQKFGKEPREVKQENGYLVLGPVERKDD